MRKRWRVMLTTGSENCKHEKMTCADCGSWFFVQKPFTKAKQRELRKLMKAIEEAEKEIE